MQHSYFPASDARQSKHTQTLSSFFFIALILLNINAKSQSYPQHYFRLPLNIPVAASGTFAEIRPNHFHGGIDLRIGGKVGEPVYAAGDGYVSRIAISSYGGGQVLYITHPNGYRSVYMHLDAFCGPIKEWVENHQYSIHSYTFDTSIPPQTLLIRKGDLVAYAGNTGSSGGPHLHFEMRYSENDDPINPLYFGFKYSDNIAPVIHNIKIYPAESGAIVEGGNSPFYLTSKKKAPKSKAKKGKGKGKKQSVQSTTTNHINVSGPFYVGIYATDASTGSTLHNGIEKIELFIDDTLRYVYNVPSYSYATTRAINSIIDYPHLVERKEPYIITRTLKGSPATFAKNTRGNGVYQFKPGTTHTFRYRVSDLAGNKTVQSFTVAAQPYTKDDSPQMPAYSQGYPVHYQFSFEQSFNTCAVSIPAGALYEEDIFTYSASDDGRFLSPVSTIGLVQNPLPPHIPYTLSMPIPKDIDSYLHSKLLIARIKGNRTTALPTRINGTELECRPTDFGSFAVTIDSTAPAITKMTQLADRILIYTHDNLSGIAHYHCYINGQWILSYFEPKQGALIIYPNRLSAAHRLNTAGAELTVEVTDAMGNTNRKQFQL